MPNNLLKKSTDYKGLKAQLEKMKEGHYLGIKPFG
jgi:hypothetical protein